MSDHSGGYVEVPDLGEFYVEAGVELFSLRFGPRFINTSNDLDAPPLKVNGREYQRGTIDIRSDGTIIDRGYQSDDLTPAARRKVLAAIEAWAGDWVQTGYATSMMWPVIEKYNRINKDRLREDIAAATNHLRELEMLAEKFRAAEPGEYVATWGTTYKLVDRETGR